MKYLFTMGLIVLLVTGCSITVYENGHHHENRDPDWDFWDWEDEEDSDHDATASERVEPDNSKTDATASEPLSNKDLKDKIQKQLSLMLPTLNERYKEYLKANPDLAGSMTVRMLVSPEGKVKSATIIENNTNNDKLASAIKRELEGFNFTDMAVGSSDIAFDIPFTFTAKKGVTFEL